LDKINFEILRELNRNAQAPFSQIANKIGVSSKTVQERFKKMVADGTILGSTIIIDGSKIGFDGKVYIGIVNKAGFDKAVTLKALESMSNIFLTTESMGGTLDILAIAMVKNLDSLITMIGKIRKMPSVEQVRVDMFTDACFPVLREIRKGL
jgi:Lrp/AsnC family transcriptional regulator, regulator for asnA, asnC and gidA